MEVFIPRWHPAPLNQLLGHWAAAAKKKKQDRKMVFSCFHGLPKATGKRQVSLHIVLKKGQRACDPDAYQKSTGDALVHAGMLTDDNRQGVEWLPIEFSRDPDNWGTRIILTDV